MWCAWDGGRKPFGTVLNCLPQFVTPICLAHTSHAFAYRWLFGGTQVSVESKYLIFQPSGVFNPAPRFTAKTYIILCYYVCTHYIYSPLYIIWLFDGNNNCTRRELPSYIWYKTLMRTIRVQFRYLKNEFISISKILGDTCFKKKKISNEFSSFYDGYKIR